MSVNSIIKHILLTAASAIGIWFIFKLILVPKYPLLIQLGSDRPLSGFIGIDTITPWGHSKKEISPEQITQITPVKGQIRDIMVTIEPLGQSNPRGVAEAKPFFVPNKEDFILIVFLWLVFIIFILLRAIEAYKPRHKFGIFLRNQTHWAKYALPCIAVWLVYWLAFFPALMSPDSLDQWGQRLNHNFSDHHPAFHTFIIWLITFLWLSPASAALGQLLVMSSLIGWGLSKFQRLGVPSVVLWIVCGLFAVSPVMGMMTISLWKDIFYAISVLWLTLLLVEVIVSDGKWFTVSWRNVILMGIVLFFIAIFRHNGPPVVFGILIILGFVYRPFWRRILLIFILCVAIYGVIRWPLYDILGVKRMNNISKHSPLLHQTAALIAAGTPLTAEEENVLDKILPIEQWRSRYHCSCVNKIIYDSPISLQGLDENLSSFRSLWFSLILKNPSKFLNHQLCASELVWNVLPRHYLYTVEYGIMVPNEFGLSTRSQLPWMRDHLIHLVDFTNKPWIRWLVWGPALYLYGTLLIAIISAFRMEKPTWLLFAMPVLLQSIVLCMINIAQDFRYQFSVYLVGLMSLCLPFIYNKKD